MSRKRQGARVGSGTVFRLGRITRRWHVPTAPAPSRPPRPRPPRPRPARGGTRRQTVDQDPSQEEAAAEEGGSGVHAVGPRSDRPRIDRPGIDGQDGLPRPLAGPAGEGPLRERATYLRQAETLRAEADSLVADIDPGDVQFDEESGEGDTLNIERERDLALSAQARQAVEEIDRALAKMADGTYGICEVSGELIPKERLEAIPWARERVEYKTGGLGRR